MGRRPGALVWLWTFWLMFQSEPYFIPIMPCMMPPVSPRNDASWKARSESALASASGSMTT